MHRPLSRYIQPYLLVAMTLLAASGWGQSLLQSDHTDSFFGESAQLSTSDSGLLTETPSFLPVNEAYRLKAFRNDDKRLVLDWQIADGYYLYREQFRFTLEGKTLSPLLPSGKTQYDEVFEKEVTVYYHQVTLELDIPIAEKPMMLEIRSQGCADAGLCYPPQDQQLLLEGDSVTLSSVSALESRDRQPINTRPDSTITLLSALIGALIGGAILNLMPCVFPVLSLKALALANSHQTTHQQHLHGLAYTAGSVSTFVLVAGLLITIRQAGFAVGWGFQLQSPIFVVALAYLFFSMALLLFTGASFGSRWTGLGQSLTQGHSLSSSFFTGALACIVASPCTAPFMATALGFAVTQPTSIALAVFAFLGLGMALPFLLLTLVPQLSRWLPRPGSWMTTFRQLLSFPLMLTAIWLLWVLGRQAGSDAVITALCGGTLIAFALWLLNSPHQNLFRSALAITALALAIYLLRITPSATQQVSNEDEWLPYTEATLTTTLEKGDPVFVNLTAAWCITCLANERVVLSHPEVKSAFQQSNTTLIKGDWTNYDPAITRLLDRFNRGGVPLYLHFPNNGSQAATILPQILSKQALIDEILQD